MGALILPKGLYCMAWMCSVAATDHGFCSDHFGNLPNELRHEFINAKSEATRLGRFTNRLKVCFQNLIMFLAQKDRAAALAQQKALEQAAREESYNQEAELIIAAAPERPRRK